MISIQIVRASEADREAITELLSSSGLTLEGIEDAEFWLARNQEETIGVIGLEIWGKEQGLLRSLAVKRDFRRQGIGADLVGEIIDEARQRRIEALYLITDDAYGYYPKFGFEIVERSTVSGDVLNSAEFRGACLQTAKVMKLKVRLPEVSREK